MSKPPSDETDLDARVAELEAARELLDPLITQYAGDPLVFAALCAQMTAAWLSGYPPGQTREAARAHLDEMVSDLLLQAADRAGAGRQH
jgi:hypothetical protein